MLTCTQCKAEKPDEEFRLLSPSAKVRLLTRTRDWHCRDCVRANTRQDMKIHRQKTILTVLEHYCNGDPRCECCGERNIKFLTMDHINDDGFTHRGRVGGPHAIARDLIKRGFPPEIVIRCYNCNLGRQRNGGICPHKEEQHMAVAAD